MSHRNEAPELAAYGKGKGIAMEEIRTTITCFVAGRSENLFQHDKPEGLRMYDEGTRVRVEYNKLVGFLYPGVLQSGKPL